MTLALRSTEAEQMDAATLDPETYARVLRDLGRANTITLAARPTLAFLRRASTGLKRVRLLDVGFGDGGMLRRIARWAKRRDVASELIGVDLNPKSAAVAEAATDPALEIRYLTGDYVTFADIDIVISSLVAHHMERAELVAFLRWMEANAAIGWFVNDLHRHRFAYVGYPILARLMRWHRVVREDGQLSIARSFRRADWDSLLAEAGITQARVFRVFPFRLCVERRR